MTITRRELLVQLMGGMAASAVVTPPNPVISRAMTKVAGRVGIPGPIRLDRNENAYGASQKAIAAIRESASEANRYPEPLGALREALASQHAVDAEQIVVGCGSSEVLRMAATAFLSQGKKLILASPTFELIRQYAQARKATVVDVRLRKNYSHDLNAILEVARKGSGLVYLCNPNNPTGTLTERKGFETFLGNLPPTFHAVIDEAYHHYAGGSGAYTSFIEQPADNPRVIVVRTFSKAYGLAGVRVGYAVASAETAKKMGVDRLPFGLNRAGVMAAIAALGDPQYIDECTRRNADDRQEFFNQVNARMLRALDSHTNFVCLNVMRPAVQVLEHYRKYNFLLAPLIPEMPTYLRISLGKPEEMHEFWRVWDVFGSHRMSM
jgi:histidinol-phosphate aminotransferase